MSTKSPIPQTIEAAKKSRLTYLIVLGVSVAVVILLGVFLNTLFGGFTPIITLVAMGVAAYSGLAVNVAGKIIKSFINTTCDSCNTRLVYNDKTKISVLKKWRTSSQNPSNGDVLAKTMFSVRVDNTCPSCRRTKTFETTLATDKIRVTGSINNIKSEVDEANLEDVVKAYFGQSIRQ
jgi:hypothetical protein